MKIFKKLFTGLIASLLIVVSVQAGIGSSGISTQFWKAISSTAIAPISDTFELGSNTNRITKIWSDALDSTTAVISSFSLGTLLTDIINEATIGIGVTIEGILSKDGYQIFQTGISPPSHVEGTLFYDESNKTLSLFTDEADFTMQIGQENVTRGINNTGSTILDGQLVYLSGESGGMKTFGLADASLQSKSISTIAMATHDIENGTVGIATRMGTVRGLNTSAFSASDIIYLSATTPGAFTTTAPSSPNWLIRIGQVGISSATVGEIEVNINTGSNTGDVIKIFNGAVLEDTSTVVSSDGVTVTLSYEKNGGGDLSLFFDGVFSILDTTPAVTISLTAGSDVASTTQYIFIPKSTMVLTKSLTSFPTNEQYVPVAFIDVQSAASIQSDGLYTLQAWTDHLSNSVEQGHLSDINSWIRKQPATSDNPTTGMLLTPTDGAATYDIATNAGNILQLHPHSVPAFNTATGSSIYIFNDSATANKKVGNMTGELTDSLGVSMSGKYYNVFYFVVSNEDSTNSKLFAQLPACSYNSSSNAIDDVNSCNNELIPSKYKSTAIPIARVTMRNQGGSGGTFTTQSTIDLRDRVGGGGSVPNTITSFSDNSFEITNVTDSTKIFNFDASGITTGTTRTYTAPDASGEICLIDATQIFTNKTFDANGTGNSLSNVDVADLANGTDGELITWDSNGAPDTVSVGIIAQVLTSNGVGAAPTFQDAAGGGSLVRFGYFTPDNSFGSGNSVDPQYDQGRNMLWAITGTTNGMVEVDIPSDATGIASIEIIIHNKTVNGQQVWSTNMVSGKHDNSVANTTDSDSTRIYTTPANSGRTGIIALNAAAYDGLTITGRDKLSLQLRRLGDNASDTDGNALNASAIKVTFN